MPSFAHHSRTHRIPARLNDGNLAHFPRKKRIDAICGLRPISNRLRGKPVCAALIAAVILSIAVTAPQPAHARGGGGWGGGHGGGWHGGGWHGGGWHGGGWH